MRTLRRDRGAGYGLTVTVRMLEFERSLRASPGSTVRIAQPSGVTVVGAAVRRDGDGERPQWFAESATVYRTARRLMEGWVFVRASALPEKSRNALADSQK